jgi:small subunit ribosomal protein S16
VAVTLKLARHGVRKNSFYRIVAAPKGAKRDGKFLEVVGTFNPMVNPPVVSLKEDKIKKWIENGAETTSLVRSIIKKNIPGYIEGKEAARLAKLQKARKARKARAKGGTPKKSAAKKKK